jgi:hypothetical protein
MERSTWLSAAKVQDGVGAVQPERSLDFIGIANVR